MLKCQWWLPLLLAQVVERLLQHGREARDVGEVELEDLVPAAAVAVFFLCVCFDIGERGNSDQVSNCLVRL